MASNPSLGIFDLTDMASTFGLAQFIFGLDMHFHTIMTTTSEFQIHPLNWRSDSISVVDPKLVLVEEQWKSRVAR